MSSTPGKALNNAPHRRRRRTPRYRCELPVALSVFAGDRHLQLHGHCRDLSEGGIGILVAADLNMGEVASLNFLLPGASQPWDVRAVLRYRRGYHYGLEFLSLSDRQGKVLQGYFQDLDRSDSEE